MFNAALNSCAVGARWQPALALLAEMRRQELQRLSGT